MKDFFFFFFFLKKKKKNFFFFFFFYKNKHKINLLTSFINNIYKYNRIIIHLNRSILK